MQTMKIDYREPVDSKRYNLLINTGWYWKSAKESKNESILVYIGNYRLPSTASGHRKYAVEWFLDYSKDNWKLCRRLAGLKRGAIGYNILKSPNNLASTLEDRKSPNLRETLRNFAWKRSGTAQGVDSQIRWNRVPLHRLPLPRPPCLR